MTTKKHGASQLTTTQLEPSPLGVYTKAALDAAIDEVTRLERAVEVARNIYELLVRQKQDATTHLQKMCFHDEGFDAETYERQNEYGDSLPDGHRGFCRLCKATATVTLS